MSPLKKVHKLDRKFAYDQHLLLQGICMQMMSMFKEDEHTFKPANPNIIESDCKYLKE